jgi:mannitol-1-phosphate 5-dehydrogenase
MGRGYVADLFNAGGYRLTLVGRSSQLMAHLQAAGRYVVVKVEPAGGRREEMISNYTALATSEADEVDRAVAAATHVVVSVYPRDFAGVAQQLSRSLLLRRAQRPEIPLDILLSTNLIGAAEQFRLLLLEKLPPEARPYFAERIGVVETMAMRGVVEPPPELRANDPLLVWTDGWTDFPVDRHALKGEIPRVPGLRLVDDMAAEQTRKLYTGNTAHAALAYLGARRCYVMIAQCLADSRVRADVEGALRESLQALKTEYEFADGNVDRWAELVMRRLDNPALGDLVARVGADPQRKLGRNDRLVGPALLAHRHEIRPLLLARAIAAALWFENPADAGSTFVRGRVSTAGLSAAVRELCGLTRAEDDLATMIEEAYLSLQ